MKNLSPKLIIILVCLLFSCHTKPEKKQVNIINSSSSSSSSFENYKIDDDELIKIKQNDTILSGKNKKNDIEKHIK